MIKDLYYNKSISQFIILLKNRLTEFVSVITAKLCKISPSYNDVFRLRFGVFSPWCSSLLATTSVTDVRDTVIAFRR